MISAKLLKRLAVFAVSLMALAYMYRWSPYKLEFLGHYDKIWAHRVNSIEKLESAINYFEGVELDLMYLENRDVLDVNHPPAESINLSFEMYMATLQDDQQPYLWLDIKNLKADNASLVLRSLQSVLDFKNYPLEKVLIETQFPDALPLFEAAGFKTSYYIPYGMTQMPTSEFEANITRIARAIHEQPNMGISSSYHDYDMLLKYFPNQTKYLWALMPAFHTNFSDVKKALNDDTVNVMLIKYNALRGNR